MKNKKIAITGGIGSGKSTVLNIIKNAGFKTISCDAVTADLYKTSKVKRLIKRLFPNAVSGFFNLKINRSVLADMVFSNKGAHKKLTDAVTPLVIKEVEKRASRLDGTIFVEVPLLFECNYQNAFDRVIVVLRDKEQRIESVKARSNLNREQILERMDSQVDYDLLDLSSYTVIKNDGDFDSLKTAVLDAIKD